MKFQDIENDEKLQRQLKRDLFIDGTEGSASKYGVSASTLMKWSRKLGWRPPTGYAGFLDRTDEIMLHKANAESAEQKAYEHLQENETSKAAAEIQFLLGMRDLKIYMTKYRPLNRRDISSLESERYGLLLKFMDAFHKTGEISGAQADQYNALMDEIENRAPEIQHLIPERDIMVWQYKSIAESALEMRDILKEIYTERSLLYKEISEIYAAEIERVETLAKI